MSEESNLRQLLFQINTLPPAQQETIRQMLNQKHEAQEIEVSGVIRPGEGERAIVETEIDGIPMQFPVALLLHAFIENPVPMSIQSFRGGRTMSNRAMAAQQGVSLAEWMTRKPGSNSYVHQADFERHAHLITTRGRIENDVALANTAEGPRYTLLNAVTLLLDGESHFLLVEQDIHELKLLEAALQQANQELQQRVEARTRDLQVAADVSRRITTVLDLERLLPELADQTRAAFDLYFVGVHLHEEELGRLRLRAASGGAPAPDDVWPPTEIDGGRGLIAQAARERRVVLANDVSQFEDYRSLPQLPETRAEMAVPMQVGADLIGVLDIQSAQGGRFTEDDVAIMTTLAEQMAIAIQNARLYKQQLQVAEDLRTADQIKSRFLASMSHELRTPLNAVLNFTDLVRMGVAGPVTDQQRDLLGKALDSGRHLLNVIGDILDISKMVSEQLTLLIEEGVDLRTEVRAASDAAAVLLRGKQVTLELNLPEDLAPVTGDRRRIRQVLLNLLSNAAKFTAEGCISLDVEQDGEATHFTVRDTGPGIPPEHMELIFEPFIQTEAGIRQAQGTGLGLPISRHLAEAHGGKLWAENQPEGGAAFHFVLPLHLAALKHRP